MYRIGLMLTFCIILTASAAADDKADRHPDDGVTLKQIMADPDWIGRSPEDPIWSDDSTTIFYQRKRKGSSVRDWFQISAEKGKPERLNVAESLKAVPRRGDTSDDRTRVVFEKNGDLFLRNVRTGKIKQLTRTASRESSPMFMQQKHRIAFRRDGALLVRDLRSGLEYEVATLLTEDEPEQKSDDDEPTKFLTRKEAELFEYLQWEEALSDAAKSYRERVESVDESRVNEPFYLGKGQSIVSRTCARNGRWVAVVLTKSASSDQRGRQDNMPVWIRDDAYVQNREVRRLVGDDAESPHRLVILDVKRHEVHEVPLDQLPEISTDRLAFLNESDADASDSKEDSASADAKPRDVSIRGVSFSRDSQYLLFQCFSTDNKDRWIVSCPTNGASAADKVTVLHHRYDEAWINWRENYAEWMVDTHLVSFVSEASGYAHLYLADARTGQAEQLTKGHFEVSSVEFSRDAQVIYYRANASHPGVYELHAYDRGSGESRQLSDLGGMNTFEVSPDNRFAVALHSELRQPPELYLLDLEGEQKPRRLTRTISREFRDIDWTVPEIVKVPSRHGHDIYARLYLPDDAQGHTGKRRAVVFVHGAGYLQNAHQGWSGYFREFMFHTLLTQRGYVVLDMDYRASAGYGRDWRTAIYRRMGTPELEDLQDGVAWLASEHNVDAKRVGVYGGSYGGFMTLMALFRSPGLFACGAALRPVTDWAHYNHGYTSNILNTPETDPEAYEISSPIYFAEGLSDPLLICHGMVDDNVFFKDTVRLTQKLIELRKSDWNVAVYPVEPHGFRHPASWYDEYRRILELFETNLK